MSTSYPDVAEEEATEPYRDSGERSGPLVVVGVDGSEGAREALVYALLEAKRLGGELEVVATYMLPTYFMGNYPPPGGWLEGIAEAAARTAREQLEEVWGDHRVAASGAGDTVPLRLKLVEGSATHHLVAESEGAAVLVVGSRGRGAAKSALLGSVSLHCVTHAHCPVAVVHPRGSSGAPQKRVVVGVDGSPESRRALARASREGVRRGAEVLVLAAYDPVVEWSTVDGVPFPTPDEIRDSLWRQVADLVAEELASYENSPNEPPLLRTEVVEGSPLDTLLEAGRDAELLVVGCRGRGALRGILLGSVALGVVMHSQRPVLVVHPEREEHSFLPSDKTLAEV